MSGYRLGPCQGSTSGVAVAAADELEHIGQPDHFIVRCRQCTGKERDRSASRRTAAGQSFSTRRPARACGC